ncbi:hypothetical protein [Diaphorobacter nitroreducens]|uniref:hypothetical protein n=1 Tax=Diaphorobacter nitroreducens TaxID=164759 RepID=UPI0028A2CE2A|nr:hypothetical protein [Diaphorobacter nitroreducens]
MHPWERRLRDLAQLLTNCGETYFLPERFRQNTNQFLQTSRTVTFIIQKNKGTIPDYDAWYQSEVLQPWKDDVVMTWAKDARNVVEKEGDLEMHSTLRLAILYSYTSSEDMVLEVTRKELLGASMEKLVKRAIDELPPAIAAEAVLKIQRKWVANSLPDHELIYGLTYAYAQLHRVCSSLASHLGGKLDGSVPHPTTIDPLVTDAEMVRFMKLTKPGVGRLVAKRYAADPKYVAPAPLLQLKAELDAMPKPKGLADIVARQARMAQVTFDLHGCHIPMLAFFDKQWKQIDFMSTAFADQADKYLFWRRAADRAFYLKAYALLWTSESWLRNIRDAGHVPIEKMPLIGEHLQVVGADASGAEEAVVWHIRRPAAPVRPFLEVPAPDDLTGRLGRISFVEPVVAAMRLAHASRAR